MLNVLCLQEEENKMKLVSVPGSTPSRKDVVKASICHVGWPLPQFRRPVVKGSKARLDGAILGGRGSGVGYNASIHRATRVVVSLDQFQH